jgi:hypothetical protein
MKTFEMSVIDTFHLSDGTTVFSGIVKPDTAVISANDCEIIFHGRLIAVLHIDGELILKNKSTSSRAISTSQKIDLKEVGLESGGFLIRSRLS